MQIRQDSKKATRMRQFKNSNLFNNFEMIAAIFLFEKLQNHRLNIPAIGILASCNILSFEIYFFHLFMVSNDLYLIFFYNFVLCKGRNFFSFIQSQLVLRIIKFGLFLKSQNRFYPISDNSCIYNTCNYVELLLQHTQTNCL